MLKQLSVFLENSPGRMAKLVRTLGDANINMHALVVADTVDYGVARVLCGDPEAAVVALRDAGMSATLTDVLAVEVADEPGALADLIDLITGRGYNIEYIYTFVEPATRKGVSVFRLDDEGAAEPELTSGGYRCLSQGDLVV